MMSFLSTFFYPTSSGSNVTKATAMSSVTSPTPAKSLSTIDESSTVRDESVAPVQFDYVSSNPNPNTSSSIQSSTLAKSSKVITVTTIKPPTRTALASIPKTCSAPNSTSPVINKAATVPPPTPRKLNREDKKANLKANNSVGTACYGGVSLLNNNYSKDPLNLSIFRRERERDIINSVWNAYYGSSGANDEFVPTRVKLHSKYQWVRRPTRSNPTLREMKMIESCTYYGRGWHFKEQDLVLSSPQPPKPNAYAEDELSWKSRLGQFKQGIDSKKNREHRLKATRQRQKEDRSQLIYKRRGALCIPEPMAVDDDEVSTTSTTTESSSTVPATQGDVVVESAKPLASLTPISSDLDDDSTIASDSTEELNEWFPNHLASHCPR
ncbi:hypothetical protein N9140_01080 [bacterium]|nr:hypothetical protein [bacterium]